MARADLSRGGRARASAFAALFLAILSSGCSVEGDPESQPAGKPAATVRGLVDIDGVPHGSLEAPAASHWTSLFFVRTDCPVSNQYAPEIRRICADYAARGMQCLLVYADPHDTEQQVRTHLADFGYALPAILDPGHALVARAGATITPEVAVFARGAAMAYRGRIDDLYTELGRPRQHVTERNLRDALDDLLAGRPVRKPRTPATGCYIE